MVRSLVRTSMRRLHSGGAHVMACLKNAYTDHMGASGQDHCHDGILTAQDRQNPGERRDIPPRGEGLGTGEELGSCQKAGQLRAVCPHERS